MRINIKSSSSSWRKRKRTFN